MDDVKNWHEENNLPDTDIIYHDIHDI